MSALSGTCSTERTTAGAHDCAVAETFNMAQGRLPSNENNVDKLIRNVQEWTAYLTTKAKVRILLCFRTSTFSVKATHAEGYILRHSRIDLLIAANRSLRIYPLHCDPGHDSDRAKANVASAVGTYVDFEPTTYTTPRVAQMNP